MDTSSPARLYAGLVGVATLIAGLVGFFYEASFDVGDELVADEQFGILAVNGWANVIHIATGLLGLAAMSSIARSRLYALGFGLVYLVVAVWGFIVIDDGFGVILEFLPVDTQENVLHLALGVLGLAAGAATPKAEPEVRRPAPAA